MSFRKTIFATAALSLAALASAGMARAADLPVKAAKPVKDIPFFLVIDDRITYSWMPNGTDPGAFSLKPNGGGFNGNTAKSVYSFTHFDLWAYGTNFFTISMFKSDHNDPASPCLGFTTNSTQNSASLFPHNGFGTAGQKINKNNWNVACGRGRSNPFGEASRRDLPCKTGVARAFLIKHAAGVGKT